MMDQELYAAEELDTFVDSRQLGQPVEPPPDLPLKEWQLADEFLRISAVVLPNDQFLDDLESQIQSVARKSTGVSSHKTSPIVCWL